MDKKKAIEGAFSDLLKGSVHAAVADMSRAADDGEQRRLTAARTSFSKNISHHKQPTALDNIVNDAHRIHGNSPEVFNSDKDEEGDRFPESRQRKRSSISDRFEMMQKPKGSRQIRHTMSLRIANDLEDEAYRDGHNGAGPVAARTVQEQVWGRECSGLITFENKQQAKFFRINREAPHGERLYKDPDKIVDYMVSVLGYELPRLIISVTGGAMDFELTRALEQTLKRGLRRAAEATDAWVITGGTDCGIMKYVGQAMAEIQQGLSGEENGAGKKVRALFIRMPKIVQA